MRIVFMGTPDFAASILQRVHEWTQLRKKSDLQTILQEDVDPKAVDPKDVFVEDISVVAVYCQPDRPAGRGHALKPQAVKCLAEGLGLPVYQPVNFRDPADCEALAALKPDILLVAAYGLLLPQIVLDIPTIAPINVHASLLPRYRGAAPIQRSIMQCDTTTGVTIMHMEAGLDTGPILLQRALVIGADETSGDLHDGLASLGVELMLELLESLLQEGQLPISIPQNEAYATHAAKLTKADGLIDWGQTGRVVHAQICGVTPWPGAQTILHLQGRKPMPMTFGVGRHFILSPSVMPNAVSSEQCPIDPAWHTAQIGAVLGLHDNCLAIRVLDGVYLLSTVCPAGKKMMPADAFVRGYGFVGHASRARHIE